MLVREVEGDVFKVCARMKRPAMAHGVNTIGVMGAGVAVKVKEYWPELFTQYEAACKNRILRPGGFLAYTTSRGGVVYNLATQDKPGKHARLEWVKETIEAMNRHCKEIGVKEVAMVRIGCGYGGLAWVDVKKTLEEAEGDLTLIVVAPKGVK